MHVLLISSAFSNIELILRHVMYTNEYQMILNMRNDLNSCRFVPCSRFQLSFLFSQVGVLLKQMQQGLGALSKVCSPRCDGCRGRGCSFDSLYRIYEHKNIQKSNLKNQSTVVGDML